METNSCSHNRQKHTAVLSYQLKQSFERMYLHITACFQKNGCIRARMFLTVLIPSCAHSNVSHPLQPMRHIYSSLIIISLLASISLWCMRNIQRSVCSNSIGLFFYIACYKRFLISAKQKPVHHLFLPSQVKYTSYELTVHTIKFSESCTLFMFRHRIFVSSRFSESLCFLML